MLKWSWLTTPTTSGYTGSAELDLTFKNSNRLIIRGNGPHRGGKGVVLSYEGRDFAVVAFNGIDVVALVFLTRDSLGGGDSAASFLYAAVGVGLLVGYALLARHAGRFPMVLMLLVGFGASSAGNLFGGLAWAVAAAFALQVVRGVGIAAMDVATNTFLQRTVPRAMLGHVFGNLYGAIGVAAGLSYVLGGFLLDLTSPRVVFVVAGVGGLLATLAAALALPRAMKATATRTATPAQKADTDTGTD